MTYFPVRTVTKVPSLLLVLVVLMISVLATVTAYSQTYDLTVDVLVNSSNIRGYSTVAGSPGEYQRYVERYLEHLQIPYRVIDTSMQGPPTDLGSVQLIVAAHTGLSLSASWQQAILQAVQGGSGFVNFDADLDIGTQPHIQGIFGATNSYLGPTATLIDVPAAVMPDGTSPHYIAAMQIGFQDTPAGDRIYNFHQDSNNVQQVATPTILLGAQGTVIAKIGSSPLILARQTSGGRAVDFTTYDFMRPDRFGFMMGIDDLIWRSMVWAARKPFIVRGYPRFYTSQMDDEVVGWGQRLQDLWNPAYTGTVSSNGTGGPWKVTAMAQLVNLQPGGQDRTAAIADVNSGNLKIAFHTNTGISQGDLYWNPQSPSSLTDAQWQTNLAYALQVMQGNGGSDTLPPLSKSMVPHFWNLSNNVGYDIWHSLGTRYLTEIQQPGAYYSYGPPKPDSMRLFLHPFRVYEIPPTGVNPNELYPLYYADYLTVGSTASLPPVQFFAFATQLLGNQFPSFDARWPNDGQSVSVQESVNNFTEYTWRFWSGMAPVQVYNHDGGSFDNSTEPERQQAITQISSFLNTNGVQHIFMENLGAYMCARVSSLLGTAQATSSTLTLNFTGNAADIDGNLVPTNFYIFYGDNEGIQQQVPGFMGGYTYSTPNAAPSAIGISKTDLTFGSLPGGPPSTQTVTVSNTGSGTLTYTAQSNVSWMTATAGSGTAPDTLTVTVDPAGLSGGAYTGVVQITSAGAINNPQQIDVTFDVQGPTLGVSGNSLNFSGFANTANPAAQNILVSNNGAGTLNWTASSSAPWLQLSATSGAITSGAPYSLAITPNIAGLRAGTYAGTVTISSSNAVSGSPQTVNVTLTLTGIMMQATFPGPTLDGWAYSPQGLPTGWSLSNGAVSYNGSGATQIYAGNSTWANYTVQTGFLLSVLSNYPGGIRGYINPSTGASYAAWLYPAEGVIKLWRTSVWSINTSATLLGTSSHLTMDNVKWHTLALSINAGQIVAYYDGVPAVSATDATLSGGMIALDVSSKPIQFANVLVTGNQAINTALTSPQSGYTFTVASGTKSSTQALQTSTSDGTIAAWSALSVLPWLTVTSPTGPTPGNATVQVNATSLAPGSYSGQLNVSSFGATNGPVTLPITVNVTQPSTNQLTFSPASLTFAGAVGGTAPAAQSLSISSTTAGLAFSVSSDSNWLTSPTSGTTSASLEVTVNQAGMAVGTYTGHLTISAPGAMNPTTTVTVKLTVSNPALVAAPASLSFVGSTTSSSPSQNVTITKSFGGAVDWTGSYTSTWFSPSTQAGTTPSTLQVVANSSGQPAGTYADTFTLVPPAGSGLTSLQLPVSLRVGTLLFSDNFTSSTNWTVSPMGHGTGWTIVNNTFAYNGGGATQQYAGSSSWADYTVQADVNLSTANNYPGGLRFRLNTATGSGYALWLYPSVSQVKLIKAPNWNIDTGSSTLITASKVSLPVGKHHVRIDVKGSTITAWVDYVQVLSITDSTYPTGAIALDVSNQPVAFSNISVVSY